MSAPTQYADQPSCVCGDQGAEQLRTLMAAGYDQAAASHLLWGDPNRVTAPPPGADITTHARLFVRRSLADAFPWLKLPRPHVGPRRQTPADPSSSEGA